jgi:ribosomal protein S27AE
MTPVTAWHAPENCPGCGEPLALDDDGTGPARLECTSCGYADTWTVTEPTGSSR